MSRRQPHQLWDGPGLSPGLLYLRVEQDVIRQVIDDLRDASADAERRIVRLSMREGLGSVVRRAQLSSIRRELHLVQTTLWRSIGGRIRTNGSQIALAASLAEEHMEEALFRLVRRGIPEPLLRAQRAYAQRVVTTYFGRSAHRVPLSERVFRSERLASGWVDRAINRVILQGGSWQEMAASVRPVIHPDTPGGVSYAAKRLARTELNNAFHEAGKQTARANPYVVAMRWHLSMTHVFVPGTDEICEQYATAKDFAPAAVPDKPHPQCLCYTAPVPMDEDDFLRSLLQSPPDDVADHFGQAQTA